MIYLDNAATSFPKPDSVLRETFQTLTSPIGNPGRSGHALSVAAANIVFRAREDLAELVGLNSGERIVFTSGCTAALNFAIKGICLALWQKGICPVVVSDTFEHNSVLRPLYDLEREGRITLYLLSPQPDGNLSPSLLFSLKPHVLVLTLRSNVTGHTFRLREAIEHLKKQGTVVIMDAAQALGSGECTLKSTGAHILCAPGHKGLLGIMGGGFLAFSPHLPILPIPLLSGGSGSNSFHEEMPEYLPERLEAGTLPLCAIASMGAGARYLLKAGCEEIGHRERTVKKYLVERLLSFPGYRVYEGNYPDGPILFNRVGTPPEILAKHLEEKGVMVRAGYHCAPLAHRHLGTEKTGAVRLSPGPFTTLKEGEKALDLLWETEREFSVFQSFYK